MRSKGKNEGNLYNITKGGSCTSNACGRGFIHPLLCWKYFFVFIGVGLFFFFFSCFFSKKSCRFPRSRKSLGACQTKRKQACLLSMDLRRPLRTSSDEVHDRRMNKNAGLYQLLLWCRSNGSSRSITAAITRKKGSNHLCGSILRIL